MDDEQQDPPEPEDLRRWREVVTGGTVVLPGIVALRFFYAEYKHQIPRDCTGFLCVETDSPHEAMWLGLVVGCVFVGGGLWQMARGLFGRPPRPRPNAHPPLPRAHRHVACGARSPVPCYGGASACTGGEGSGAMSGLLQVLSAFLASSVEMVEALTIVLAVGITRGWRTALTGVAAALAALAVVVAALGPSLATFVPIDVLRVVVGMLLLIFGLQWLRKAILRASGRKALHDEDLIYRREIAELGTEPALPTGLDWTGFVVSFKGVFLEGLEVAFIVVTFGANAGRFDLSIAGAVSALVLVTGVGLVVHRPLSRVPENAIKFAVGLMLTAFGTFWGGEGVGIEWGAGDVMLPVLLLIYGLSAALLVNLLRSRTAPVLVARTEGSND